jgi:hypothetical protein
MLFLLGERDIPAGSPVPGRWTSIDSLRAMAHLGEPVHGQTREARFLRMENAAPEPASRNDHAESAVRENPSIWNAQAKMELRKTAAARPRKQKFTSRQVRVRTAVAENPQRMPSDVFPPSW